jgi:hypothetical protein
MEQRILRWNFKKKRRVFDRNRALKCEEDIRSSQDRGGGEGKRKREQEIIMSQHQESIIRYEVRSTSLLCEVRVCTYIYDTDTIHEHPQALVEGAALVFLACIFLLFPFLLFHWHIC